MRTLVISDLHLGSMTDVDVLRRPGGLSALLDQLHHADRLVLLGDTLELRHGPANDALSAAYPTLARIGAALPDSAEAWVVAGNHDHSMVAPYLDYASEPVGLDTEISLGLASPIARGLAEALGRERTRFFYPGVWITDDVYAMHGHYADVVTTMPLFERIAAGLMARFGTHVPERGAVAEDFERLLAPIYAWLDSTSQRTPPDQRTLTGAGRGAQLYSIATGKGSRRLSHRAIAVGYPLAIRAAVPLVGPLSADLSIGAVRRSSLHAMGEVIARLGIDAKHVISGHSHRAGPLPSDIRSEWVTDSGVRLHNTGNWVFEHHFMPSPHVASPYWPGRAIVVRDDAEPELIQLLGDFVPAGV